MANAKEKAQAEEQAEALQPNRYFEREDFVPNPTDQYGTVLTHGPGVDTTEGMDYGTPLFREHRAAVEGEEPTDDEYYLTRAQRAAAESVEDEEAAEEEPVAEPTPAKQSAPAKSEPAPAQQ